MMDMLNALSKTVQSVSQANLGLESKESADDVEVSVINSDTNNEQIDPLLLTGGHGKDESKIYDKDEHQSRAFKNNDGDRRSDSKKTEKEKPKRVSFFEVCRYANSRDKLMMLFGSLCAICNGVLNQSINVVFGDMTQSLVSDQGKVKLEHFLDNDIRSFMVAQGLTKEAVLEDITLLDNPITCGQLAGATNFTCADIPPIGNFFSSFAQYAELYCYIGTVVMIISYFQYTMFAIPAERQAFKIRQAVFRNVLKQDIGWFDTHEPGELNTKMSIDIMKIKDGIGSTVSSLLNTLSECVSGVVFGFKYGWKLSLVILSVGPLLTGTVIWYSKIATSLTEKELKAYSKAGSLAEEVLGNIRTVVAFGGQEKEIIKYSSNLKNSEAFGIKKSFIGGVSFGAIRLVASCIYGIGLWYGAKLVRDEPENYSVADVFKVLQTVMSSAFSIGGIAPTVEEMATARGAAFSIFALIDLKSKIDSSSEEGQQPASIEGTIELKNIEFSYPSRPEVPILKGVSLKILPGQTLALVGSSGCGKSTTAALLQRFYDPLRGKIYLDGNDIKDLNVTWLRKHIGVVSQEPILFSATIADNIRYGGEDVTMELIEQAAKKANAYDFIMDLPLKFHTPVGEGGAQLSGGQKQRVAIARALVRDPKILILDEATSALDTESESIVQDALDKARQGRTTVVIAHRLSTIKTADIICGFDKGMIVERGTHNDLMSKKGIYYQLVSNQTVKKEHIITEDPEDAALKKVNSRTDSDTLIVQQGHICGPGQTFSAPHKLASKALSKMQVSTIALENDDKENDQGDNRLTSELFCRIIKMNRPELHFIILACMCSVINGLMEPISALILTNIYFVFAKQGSDQEKFINIFFMLFVGVGIVSFVSMFTQMYFFAIAGARLTTRLRDQCFRSMLRQEMSWFDDNENSTGALTARLSTDTALVQGVTGMQIGSKLVTFASIGVCILIAFIFSPKLTAVILSIIPFAILASVIAYKVSEIHTKKLRAGLEGAGKVAVESLGNIRTVVSLSRESISFEKYMMHLQYPYKSSIVTAHIVGIVIAISSSLMYFMYAGISVYGGYLIEQGELTPFQVMAIIYSLIFAVLSIASITAFAPNVSRATVAARQIVKLLDSQPTLDYTRKDGKKLPEDYKAEVQFNLCEFRYATRPTVKVLRGLSFSVSPGETVALVGSSGCGKSTSVALIERFYDVEGGSVSLDSHDVKSLNIEWFRSQIGIVFQEPVLFDRSIAENIAYGDNSRVVSMDEIISAARGANIHNFISQLPKGYETVVGGKGSQLSGGQKQRVAIARALVRNPKILLLDEATSALDTESERVVQEALDKARKGRTCVVVAHRLSTIQNADKICVFYEGSIAEEGTHMELMAKKGSYFRLVKSSARKSDLELNNKCV